MNPDKTNLIVPIVKIIGPLFEVSGGVLVFYSILSIFHRISGHIITFVDNIPSLIHSTELLNNFSMPDYDSLVKFFHGYLWISIILALMFLVGGAMRIFGKYMQKQQFLELAVKYTTCGSQNDNDSENTR